MRNPPIAPSLPGSRGSQVCLIALGSLALAFPSLGQQRYTGPHLLGDSILGEASYHFITVRGDTLLHGPFQFASAHTEPGDDLHIRSLELAGTYERDVRTGEWSYRAKDLRATSEPSLTGFDLVRRTSGKERLISGGFKAGRAHGAWQAMGRIIEDGTAKDTVFAVNCLFNEGRFTGLISGHMRNTHFSGRFSDGGMPDGPWTFVHALGEGASPIAEVMTYDKGMLVGHTMEIEGDTGATRLELWRSPGRPDDALEIPLSDGYFRTLRYSAMGAAPEGPSPTTRPDTVLARTGHLMMRTLTTTGTVASPGIWRALAGSEAIQAPVVRVVHHPLEERERKVVADILRMYRESMGIIDHHSKDPLVDLGRYAFEEVERNHAIIAEYAARMVALEPVVRMLADPVARFMDRDALLLRALPMVSYPDSVEYIFKDQKKVFAHRFASGLQHGSTTVSGLHAHLQEAHADMVDLGRRTDRILERYKAESKLAENEEKLVMLRDSLLELYGENPDKNAYHDMVADRMRDLVTTLFKEYGEQDLEERAERITGVLNCFQEAMDTYTLQSKIPLRLERLDGSYTRSVWNPYTFTFMEERVKERVYRAHENVLLPFLVGRMAERVACGSMRAAQDDIVVLYQRMEELRGQDTRELERQLRRVSDPQELIGILSLQLDMD